MGAPRSQPCAGRRRHDPRGDQRPGIHHAGFWAAVRTRLNQAIRAYVANYPVEGNAGLDARVPLADQVEFRILPKLRGVEIDTNRHGFDNLVQMVRETLDDAVLAERIEATCEAQARGAGLFVWRGLAREA